MEDYSNIPFHEEDKDWINIHTSTIKGLYFKMAFNKSSGLIDIYHSLFSSRGSHKIYKLRTLNTNLNDTSITPNDVWISGSDLLYPLNLNPDSYKIRQREIIRVFRGYYYLHTLYDRAQSSSNFSTLGKLPARKFPTDDLSSIYINMNEAFRLCDDDETIFACEIYKYIADCYGLICSDLPYRSSVDYSKWPQPYTIPSIIEYSPELDLKMKGKYTI